MIRSKLNTLCKRSLAKRLPVVAASNFINSKIESSLSSFSTNAKFDTSTISYSGADLHVDVSSIQESLLTASNSEVNRRKSKPGTTRTRPAKGNHRSDRKSDSGIVSTEWVSITNIPPLSTLDDLLVDIERIMTTELSMGIVDLDAAEKMMDDQSTITDTSTNTDIDSSASASDEEQPQLPIWQPDVLLPAHLVVEARLSLSTLKRPTGWFIRFPSRSVVHALLSHIEEANKIEREFHQLRAAINSENTNLAKQHKKENIESAELLDVPQFSWKDLQTRPLVCAYKRAYVVPIDITQRRHRIASNQALNYGISDNVVRVENCSRDSTMDDVRYFFNRYDIADERTEDNLKSVDQIVTGSGEVSRNKNTTPSKTNSFLVRFASAADARAAVREKQNVEFMGRRLRLAQYSRQIISQGTESESLSQADNY